MFESSIRMNSPSQSPDQRTAALLPERFLFAACLGLILLAVILIRENLDEVLLLGSYGGANARWLAFWKFATYVGSNWTLAPAVAIFGALLAWRRRQEAALWLVSGWAMTCSTVELLKWLIARARPPVPFLTTAMGGSFPSGHAAESLFVFFYLWIVLGGSPFLRHRGLWGAGLRELFSTLLAVLPPLVGYSRVYLGVHWPSDVLAGWAIGFFVLGIAFLGTPRGGEKQSKAGGQQTEVIHKTLPSEKIS